MLRSKADVVRRACLDGRVKEAPPRTGNPRTRFGGPTQDFRVPDHGLADDWPRRGPGRFGFVKQFCPFWLSCPRSDRDEAVG